MKPITHYPFLPIIKHGISAIEGIENLPNHNPFIIAANHISTADPLFLIGAILPRYHKKIHFISNPGRHSTVFLDLIATRWAGCIIVDRDNPTDCIKTGIKKLTQKKLVGIFPEGARFPVGDQLGRGKTGVIRMALATKCSILPVGIITQGEPHRLSKEIDTHKFNEQYPGMLQKNNTIYTYPGHIVNPETGKKINLTQAEEGEIKKQLHSYTSDAFKKYIFGQEKAKLVIGKPFNVPDIDHSTVTYSQLRELTDSLMRTISTLCGRSYPY